jgi:hypothetical protein
MRHTETLFAALLVAAVIVGCGPANEIYPKTRTVRGYDFTKYTDQGFLITPERFRGSYQSIGTLRVTVFPGLEYDKKEPAPAQPGPDDPEKGWVVVSEVTTEEVIDSLYSQARRMGADAVTQFETEIVSQNTEDVTRYGIQARGFAIKRK